MRLSALLFHCTGVFPAPCLTTSAAGGRPGAAPGFHFSLIQWVPMVRWPPTSVGVLMVSVGSGGAPVLGAFVSYDARNCPVLASLIRVCVDPVVAGPRPPVAWTWLCLHAAFGSCMRSQREDEDTDRPRGLHDPPTGTVRWKTTGLCFVEPQTLKKPGRQGPPGPDAGPMWAESLGRPRPGVVQLSAHLTGSLARPSLPFGGTSIQKTVCTSPCLRARGGEPQPRRGVLGG